MNVELIERVGEDKFLVRAPQPSPDAWAAYQASDSAEVIYVFTRDHDPEGYDAIRLTLGAGQEIARWTERGIALVQIVEADRCVPYVGFECVSSTQVQVMCFLDGVMDRGGRVSLDAYRRIQSAVLCRAHHCWCVVRVDDPGASSGYCVRCQLDEDDVKERRQASRYLDQVRPCRGCGRDVRGNVEFCRRCLTTFAQSEDAKLRMETDYDPPLRKGDGADV